MLKYIILIFAISNLLSQDVYGGYTLFTPGGGGSGSSATTYLKDVDNTNYNTWSHSNGPASMPYLYPGDESGFENTLLYYPCRSSNPTMESGGVGGKVIIYNWEGDELWNYQLSNNDYQHHHDIDVLPNGNILMVAWERLYSSTWQALGRTSVDNSLNQMWTTAIFEIQPDLQTGGSEVVWEWHLTDHLIQDSNSSLSNYGDISNNPQLMDVNCGSVGSNGGPGGQANGDWMHVNAIDYNEALDQIAISARHQNEIYIIDHSTTTEEAASHTGGNSNKGGDFLYRWGNPQNYDRGNNSDEILDSQHSVNWIPVGYPGEGNLILYNNKHSSNSSAALEFVPPIDENGNYILLENEAYGPETWEWLHQGGFFSDVQSGAFRLPNGNTLITDANDAYIFEVDSNGNELWDYNYSSGNSNVMIARAQKYGYDYFDNPGGLSGDVNGDEIINVLDIILTVNIILGSADFNQMADVNGDTIVNVLDIVALVNIILGSQQN